MGCPKIVLKGNLSEMMSNWQISISEEFALGTDPKSLHATVLMQMVYNAVVWHSGGFLKHVAISVVNRVKITAA